MAPSSKPPNTFKSILQENVASLRPSTPQTLNPFILVHDPLTKRLYSTIPSIPPAPPPQQNAFTLSPKRIPKREIWSHAEGIELHTHILRLRAHYSHHPPRRQARDITAKTPNFFIFRTLLATEERSLEDFTEAWYIIKLVGQGGGGLGRGDDAGGLEDVSRTGRVKCKEIWKEMDIRCFGESDEE